jgi:hypothetical protein
MAIGDDISIGAQNHSRAGSPLARHHRRVGSAVCFLTQRITGGEDLHHRTADAPRKPFEFDTHIAQRIDPAWR